MLRSISVQDLKKIKGSPINDYAYIKVLQYIIEECHFEKGSLLNAHVS
jgi:hypothetical protein